MNPNKVPTANVDPQILVSNAAYDQMSEKQKRNQRATMSDNTDEQVAIEDTDPRFLHILGSSEGADVSRRYFKNIQPHYLMKKCKNLETHNMDLFCRFIYMGKAMIDYAAAGDLNNFKRLFSEADDKEILYWHLTKCLKAAIKNKRMLIIEFIIEDLDMPLGHEAFEGYLHMFIFQC